jgi:hypothetical protein
MVLARERGRKADVCLEETMRPAFLFTLATGRNTNAMQSY